MGFSLVAVGLLYGWRLWAPGPGRGPGNGSLARREWRVGEEELLHQLGPGRTAARQTTVPRGGATGQGLPAPGQGLCCPGPDLFGEFGDLGLVPRQVVAPRVLLAAMASRILARATLPRQGGLLEFNVGGNPFRLRTIKVLKNPRIMIFVDLERLSGEYCCSSLMCFWFASALNSP